MPVMNSGIHLKPAIDSLLRTTKEPFKLILVESESKDGTAELCDQYAQNNWNIEVIHTKREGITKAINKGIQKADSTSDILLTQDDVIWPQLYNRDWLLEMKMWAIKEEVGMVIPINGGGISGPTYLNGFKFAGTWALYITRNLINKIGLLDENFSPGPGDDICFSYRAWIAGFKVATANFWVDHHRQTENFNDHIEDVKEKNATYFRKKYQLDNYGEWQQTKLYAEEKVLEYEEILKIPIEAIKGKKVLDYGSGNGRDARELIKRGAIVDVCDIAEVNLKYVKENTIGLNQAFLLERSNKIPVADETYDFINLNGVLHHIEDGKSVLKELNRILKKEGIIYIMVYSEGLFKIHLPHIIESIKKNHDLRWENEFGKLTDTCNYSTFYNSFELVRLLIDNGFKAKFVGDFHNGQFRVVSGVKV